MISHGQGAKLVRNRSSAQLSQPSSAASVVRAAPRVPMIHQNKAAKIAQGATTFQRLPIQALYTQNKPNTAL